MRGKFNKRIVWIRTEKRTRTHSVCVLEGSACERGRKKERDNALWKNNNGGGGGGVCALVVSVGTDEKI